MSATLALMDMYFGARRNFSALHGAKLHSYQDQRARRIVAHAVARSPFYARHYAHQDPLTDPRRWRTLPVTDKQLMMANFQDFNTRGITLEDALRVAVSAEQSGNFAPTLAGLTVGLSTGTSGHRSVFLASRAEMARWVGVILARLLPPFRLRGYTITLFSMSGSNLYDDLRGRWLRFHHHNLATPLDLAVARLNIDQPDLLCGPPGYLHALAERRRAGELRIAPCKVVSVAEVLEPHIADELQQAFACPIHQIYQCTEGLVAISCPLGRLHAQEDVVAPQFERLSPDDAAMGLVVTDLWHHTQPIIRYRLGDIVTLAPDACNCGSGFQVIDQVEGRSDDVCEFARADGSLRQVFPATLRRAVMLASDGVADYDALQNRPSHLRVRLSVHASADVAQVQRAVGTALRSTLEAQGAFAPEVIVEIAAPSPHAGKRRRIQRRRTAAPVAVLPE